MKQRGKGKASSAEKQGVAASAKLSRGRLWCFRILAVIGAPVVFVGLVEMILRLAGYGYPTAFLLPQSQNGQRMLIQNNQFGWRFFAPELARHPYPLALTPRPAPGVVRILVFGESAAKGDPDPRFGLPRMLETLLSLRHSGVHFEVVNAAMTAINSHTILPIVRDCSELESDVWVLYMGNNEVVGPFGAGTVFGAQSPPLSVVRGALALKTMRTGQLLDSLLQPPGKSPDEVPEWGGMEMFLNQQVAADDARLKTVYDHFERNLRDILHQGKDRGVGIVVSTVAVNLKDCAPFASAHGKGLVSADKARWEEQFQMGTNAQVGGRWQEAASHYAVAAQLDNAHAELRFRQGQAAWHLGEGSAARQHYQAACDLDTLRFRCDSRLNEITRRVVTASGSAHCLLADAEHASAAQSEDGLPGEKLFYEHVHLTFAGNYLVARTIAEQVERLLQPRLSSNPSPDVQWPLATECAQRLAWSDWSHASGWKGLLPRLRNPPFTGQFDHGFRMEKVAATLSGLATAVKPAGISNALAACAVALATAPQDEALLDLEVKLRQASGDLIAATTSARRRLALLPGDAEGWLQLGLLLARQRQYADAVLAFDRATALDSLDIVAWEHLAQTLGVLGRRQEAEAAFRHVVRMKPRFGIAWLHYGLWLESQGRKDEATECFRKALGHSGKSVSGLIEIAGFCQSRQWFEAAATNYVAATRLEPTDARLHVGAGQNLAALNRLVEARDHAATAVQLSPDFPEAHLLYGLILGRQGQLEPATEEFRAALRLNPELLDARINLGIAMAEKNPSEALEQFEAVLRVMPTHPTALNYVPRLRARMR